MTPFSIDAAPPQDSRLARVGKASIDAHCSLIHSTQFAALNMEHATQLLNIASLWHLAEMPMHSHVQYSILMRNLALGNLREVEDLIIEAIYADIIKGKLNQKEERLEVDFVIGRDIRVEMVDNIISVLDSWRANCETAMSSLEAQIQRGNDAKEIKIKQNKMVEDEVEAIQKALKSQEETLNRTPLEDLDVESSNQQARSSGHKLKAFKSSMKTSTSRTR